MSAPGVEPMAMLEHLVPAHQARLRAYLYSRTGDIDAADDLAQETFLVAFRLIVQYDPSRPAWPWLMGIARNELREYWRAAARHKLVDQIEALAAERLLVRDAQSRDADDDRTLLEALGRCLDRLPPRSRELVRLLYRERLNCAQAAQALGETAGAVRTAIHRVRKALHTCVQAQLERGPA